MATWVTHLIIADAVMNQFPKLDRRGFCVGNIAPDCNVENEDWTAFTPSREVTHWMQGERKKASDCDAFCQKYIVEHRDKIKSAEEYAFLLGYYSHLMTDAAFQAFIRDENRVKAVWKRIKENSELSQQCTGMEETWDSIKKLVSKGGRMREIYTLEAEYLQQHPDSGYLTEILPLKEFPDYIDYLPHGCIARKISVMGYIPKADETLTDFLTISKGEYTSFLTSTVQLVSNKFTQMHKLLFHDQLTGRNPLNLMGSHISKERETETDRGGRHQ